MKKIVFNAIVLLSIVFSLKAQEYRYVESIFSSVDKTADVVYGTAPFLNSPYTNESATTTGNLVMDIYQPAGDTVTKRPAIIFAHGGGFYEGSRNVDDMVAFCDSFARKGYVTITIDYRQGVQVADNADMHYARAAYRGIQDGRTAVRYLRANAAAYGIDTNNIYWGGNSAGSFIGLHAIFMDASEKPASAGPVSYDISMMPFTGPDLGDLDIGNNLKYSGEPNAVMACWGGIGDTLMIQAANDQPVFLVHGTADAIVPFNSGPPFNLSGVSDVYGSNPINTRLNSLGLTGNQTYFVPGEDHEFYGVTNGDWDNGTGGNAYWDTVVVMATAFYWQQNKPSADFSAAATDMVFTFTDASTGANAWIWDFGDGNSSEEQNPDHTYASEGDYQVSLYITNNLQSWDTITKTVTAAVGVTTYNLTYTAGANGSISGTATQTVNDGEHGTAVEAVPNTGYHFVSWSDGDTTNPRVDSNINADITVEANFELTTGVTVSDNNKMNVVVFPNPASDKVFILSNNHPVNSIRLINTLGQVVLTKEADDIREIAVKHLPKGLYYMVLQRDDEMIMKKLIIN
ncbi:MAG: PKD domain-containing protein [Bacteroidota bacterium]